MEKTFYIISALLCVLFAACAPKEPEVRPVRPSHELFGEAERKYEQSEYSKAHELYRKYVEEYPDTTFTPAAYLKLGMIRAQWKDFDKAREIYGRVIDRYPETPYAQQSRIKILESYVDQGRFRETVRYRERIPDSELEPDMLIRADLLAGDAHMALEQFRSAYRAFASAYRKAGREKRHEMTDRLLAAVSMLEQDFIDSEAERLGAKPPVGFLMYQQGLNFKADRSIEDALSLFTRFLEQFPDHPIAGRVEAEMVSLTTEGFLEGNTIGCVLPLSGKYEKFGRQVLRGIELALADASRFLEADTQLKILVRDSASEPGNAQRAVEDLAEKRVAGVIGPIADPSEAADTAQKLRVPIIVLSQEADIVDTGEYVFQNFITPEMQVKALVNYATGRLGCRNFAVLYPEEPYGRTFLKLFQDRVVKKNARLVGIESYNPEHTDFAEPIKKLAGIYYGLPLTPRSKQLGKGQLEALAGALGMHGIPFAGETYPSPDAPPSDGYESGIRDDLALDKPAPRVSFEAIFIPDSPEKAGLIIPQLRYYDINNAYLLGTNLWHSQELIDIAGDQIRDAVIPEGFFAKSRRKHVREFVEKFKDVYEYEPGFLEAAGYDTAMILCRRISDKDLLTRPELQRSLVQMPPYEGVTGRTEFHNNGGADKSLYLLNVSRQRFSEIRR